MESLLTQSLIRGRERSDFLPHLEIEDLIGSGRLTRDFAPLAGEVLSCLMGEVKDLDEVSIRSRVKEKLEEIQKQQILKAELDERKRINELFPCFQQTMEKADLKQLASRFLGEVTLGEGSEIFQDSESSSPYGEGCDPDGDIPVVP